MNPQIRKFLQDCYSNYIPSICESVKDFPEYYIYPTGNPIKPVLPVQLACNKLMVIGAFPSARFARINQLLIPIADNLSPFGEEKYFDGREIRFQASRESLNKNYFPQLGIEQDKLWLTDLVKIYLYQEKHIKNCKIIAPEIEFINTHKMFFEIAKASRPWILKEIELCNPSLIITLGEITARVISSELNLETKRLLSGNIYQITLDKNYRIAHLAHPEIRRLNRLWDQRTSDALIKLRKPIKNLMETID